MPGVIEPPRRTAWMRKREEDAALLTPSVTDSVLECDAPPETVDRHRAQEHEYSRHQELKLGLQPRGAQFRLRRRRAAVTYPADRLSWKAFRDGGAVRELVLADSGPREPTTQDDAGASRERHPGCELDRARGLTNDGDAVEGRAGNDRPRERDVPGVGAARASPDAAMEALEPVQSSPLCGRRVGTPFPPSGCRRRHWIGLPNERTYHLINSSRPREDRARESVLPCRLPVLTDAADRDRSAMAHPAKRRSIAVVSFCLARCRCDLQVSPRGISIADADGPVPATVLSRRDRHA